MEAYNGLGVVQRVRKDYDAELRQKLAPARGGDGAQKASPDDAVDAALVGYSEDVVTTPSEARWMKVLQSIGDASAVATASHGDLGSMPLSEGMDLQQFDDDFREEAIKDLFEAHLADTPVATRPSKPALVRTLEGHSGRVRRAASTVLL